MAAETIFTPGRRLLNKRGGAQHVTVRAMLMAGVAAVGIATATAHGPVSVPVPAVAAPSAYVSSRVSTQDVQLAAGAIPIVSDIGIAALSVINAVDTLLTTGVNLAVGVTGAIPLVSALAPQINYIYFCVLRSFVYFPLAGAALFAATLNPTHLVDIAVHIINRLVNFVQYEIDYFINLPQYLFSFAFLPVGLGLRAAAAGPGALADAVPGDEALDASADKSVTPLVQPEVGEIDGVESTDVVVEDLAEVAEIVETDVVIEEIAGDAVAAEVSAEPLSVDPAVTDTEAVDVVAADDVDGTDLEDDADDGKGIETAEDDESADDAEGSANTKEDKNNDAEDSDAKDDGGKVGSEHSESESAGPSAKSSGDGGATGSAGRGSDNGGDGGSDSGTV